jgi:hypothetical protein
MKEHWKPIQEVGGCYLISDYGNVYSHKTNKILKVGKGKWYPSVTLMYKGKRCQFYVHVLVAKYFIGSCPRGKEVNHKDLNKGNNRVDNLEYKTHKKNIHHAIRNGVEWGLANIDDKEIHPHRPAKVDLTASQTKKICSLYASGKYTMWKLATKFGTSGICIWRIIHKFKVRK